MTRKSSEQRLNDIRTAREWYVQAGLENDGRARFLSDMADKIERGRYPTTKQRNWADKLFAEGPPKIHNIDRVKEITELSQLKGFEAKKAGILADFAGKLAKGWGLSEKQEAFLANLVADAKKFQKDGPFLPKPEVIADLEVSFSVLKHKNGWYWQHRVGTSKAFEAVSRWLEWYWRDDAMKDVTELTGRPHEPVDAPRIDQWSCDKVLSACKKQIAEIKTAKHEVGVMIWSKSHNTYGLVSGAPRVSAAGTVVYPCLVNGELVDICTDKINKRLPKNPRA